MTSDEKTGHGSVSPDRIASEPTVWKRMRRRNLGIVAHDHLLEPGSSEVRTAKVIDNGEALTTMTPCLIMDDRERESNEHLNLVRVGVLQRLLRVEAALPPGLRHRGVSHGRHGK